MIGWAGESHLNSGKQQENIGARSPSVPSSAYGFPGAAPLSSYPAAKTALLTPNPKVFRSAGRSCAPPCTTHPSLPPAAHLLATASPPGEADQPAQKRLRMVKPPRTRSTRGREHRSGACGRAHHTTGVWGCTNARSTPGNSVFQFLKKIQGHTPAQFANRAGAFRGQERERCKCSGSPTRHRILSQTRLSLWFGNLCHPRTHF